MFMLSTAKRKHKCNEMTQKMPRKVPNGSTRHASKMLAVLIIFVITVKKQTLAETCVRTPPEGLQTMRTMSEGKVRRGWGERKQLSPQRRGHFRSPHQKKSLQMSSIAPRESILQDGIISLK